MWSSIPFKESWSINLKNRLLFGIPEFVASSASNWKHHSELMYFINPARKISKMGFVYIFIEYLL